MPSHPAGPDLPAPPRSPGGAIDLAPPPGLGEDRNAAGSALLTLFPALGALGSIAVLLTGTGDRTRSFLAGGMFLAATLGFLLVQVDRGRRQRSASQDEARTDYLHYLAQVRVQVQDVAAEQRRALFWHFPEPTALPILAQAGSRVWERSPGHDHHLDVRFGRTSWPLAVTLNPPTGAPVERADPVAASALHRLLNSHRVQPDLPAMVGLTQFDRIEVCGPTPVTTGTATAMLLSAVTFHPPQDLAVAVLTTADRMGTWDWLKWVPHARSPHRRDALGGLRMVSTDPADLLDLVPTPPDTPLTGPMAAPTAGPHLLVVLDGVDPGPGWSPGPVTVLDLRTSWSQLQSPRHLRLLVDPPAGGRVLGRSARVPAQAITTDREPRPVALDQCPAAVAVATARFLLRDDAAARSPSADLGVLLGLGDLAALDRDSERWRRRAPEGAALLRVPIGVDDADRAVWLDLKESAQHGMGPHGLVIGATGSGKSEFLRTLVLGLAVSHPPEVLNVVLVDFKGGATFAGLGQLPHCSALITNLAEETTLVQRMQDALGGELLRRQEVLRAAGSLASQREYQAARSARPDLPALPLLLVVVDEFSELLSAHPEFVDLFVAIGRLGRSLGIHLVLASQRLDEGRLRGLESHLSYRVALRTFSAAESRAVVGVPDAHDLPNQPGVGLLRTDPSTLVRFTACYVSGPVADSAPTPTTTGSRVLPLTLAPLPPEEDPDTPPVPEREAQESLLERTVSTLVRAGGTPAHRIWLPPLDEPPTVGALLPDLTTSTSHGLHSPRQRADPLRVPVGIVDRPRLQRRDTWWLDLAGAAGHVAVVGAPRSGRSTVLRTLVATLALGHTPGEAEFHLLDLSGSLSALAGHPHVAGVATRAQPDVVHRMVAHVQDLVARRESWFREHRVDSAATHRALVRAGGGDGHGEVFLVVDGWSTLRAEFEDLEPVLQQIAAEGLGYGVHLLLSAGRWTDVRTAMRDLLGSRVELKLGDPLDSEVNRHAAAAVPRDRPGRGLTPEGDHGLTALPDLRPPDGTGPAGLDGADGLDGLDGLVAAARRAWTGPEGPKLKLLPERVLLAGLVAAAPGDGLVLGIAESTLTPVVWEADEHLLVYGDSGSGKSAALRTLVCEVSRTRSPQQAQFVVLDPRRSLLGAVGPEHLTEYVTSHADATTALAGIGAHLQHRLPGDGVTASQLRDRSWWSGPEVFVVVDDHDLLAGHRGSPVEALLPLLPHARDIGLHLVLARRTGGAGRAHYEPVMQALRDLATPGLLLSGSPDEGPLVGQTKARPSIPGRAQWVTRHGAETLQVAWTPAPT